MIWQRALAILVFAVGWPLCPVSAWADAIVVTKAMSAATVAEIFVGKDSIRVELEIGVRDLAAFKNLLPDEIYEKLGFDKTTQTQRLQQFFNEDWVIRTGRGNVLSGRLANLEARKRIQRDEITGKPLAQQSTDVEIVVYAELVFELNGKPESVSIKPPTRLDAERVAANIGFVTYHQGLPVTDFRYLSGEEILDLDWEDPWFSQFRNPNLRRKFDSPVSAFLYIESFEVRKEIVIRPVDLQRWIDLGIDANGVIPVAAQADLKQRVAEYLKDKHPVTIDGQAVQGEVDRIHFISRTLRKTGVVYPDEDLPAISATLGVIFIYPIESLPQQVTMTWESFDARLKQIPVSATDEAGGLPSTLTPDDPVLVWNNYLTHPTVPAARSVPAPAVTAQISLPLVSIAFVCAALISTFFMTYFTAHKRKWLVGMIVSLAIAGACLPFGRVSVANPVAKRTQLTDQTADEIMDSLLHNLYHAFDRRQESLVYDQLATVLSGDLLREIYLQTRQQIQLADQGGAQVKIDEIELLTNELLTVDEPGFTTRCNWVVSGTIGHWGHLHRRQLGFEANFLVEPTDEGWKITSMQITGETQPEILEAESR